MWNNTFAGNIATHEGGAIAIVNSHGKGILLGDSKLHNNVALAGGAIYGGSGVVLNTIPSSVVVQCTCSMLSPPQYNRCVLK